MPPQPVSSSSSLQHRPLPSFRHRPLPSIFFPIPSTLPPLPGICSFSAPPSFWHRPSPVPSAPSLLAPFGQTGPNGGPLFGLVWPNRGPSFDHVWPNEGPWPNKSPLFGQTGPNKGPSFGPIWPNGARREGALRAGKGQCRKAEKGRRERASARE